MDVEYAYHIAFSPKAGRSKPHIPPLQRLASGRKLRSPHVYYISLRQYSFAEVRDFQDCGELCTTHYLCIKESSFFD